MKIEFGKKPGDVKFLDDDGRDITKSIPARRVTITAEIDRPVTAEIDLAWLDGTSVESAGVEYYCPRYGKIKGIVTEDNQLVMLPEKMVK